MQIQHRHPQRIEAPHEQNAAHGQRARDARTRRTSAADRLASGRRANVRRVVREPIREHEADRPEHGAQQQRRLLSVDGAQISANDPGEEQRDVHRRPLNRLQTTGQSERLTGLHHQRIDQHVAERDADRRQQQPGEQQPVRALRHRKKIQERADPPTRKHWKSTGNSCVAIRTAEPDRTTDPNRHFQRPRQREQCHERSDRRWTVAPTLQQRTNGLCDQSGSRITDALNEVHRRKKRS